MVSSPSHASQLAEYNTAVMNSPHFGVWYRCALQPCGRICVGIGFGQSCDDVPERAKGILLRSVRKWLLEFAQVNAW